MVHSSWYGIKPYWSLKEVYMGSGDCVCKLLLGVVTLQGSLSAAATNLCVCCVLYIWAFDVPSICASLLHMCVVGV